MVVEKKVAIIMHLKKRGYSAKKRSRISQKQVCKFYQLSSSSQFLKTRIADRTTD